MLDRLGFVGVLGALCCLGGLGIIASVAPVVAGGFALVLVGLALLVRGVLSSVLSAFGMDGLV